MMQHYIGNTQSPNQLTFMILIAKVFYMSNTMKLLPFLAEPGKLCNWIEFITAVLDSQQDKTSHLVQPTDDLQTIENLDKHEWWKLKGICAKISLKLYSK